MKSAQQKGKTKKKTTQTDVAQNLRIGELLSNIRSVAKVSQIKLAAILNTEQSAVSRIESGFQNLSLYELHTICNYFDIRADEFLRDEVDYWKLAEKFGTRPPYPARYQEHPHLRFRSVSPFLEAITLSKGESFKNRILADLDFEDFNVRSPNQKIGSRFQLDLFEQIEKSKLSTKALTPTWLSMSLTPKCLGELHPPFSAFHSKKDAVLGWYLNADQFESNFNYQLQIHSESELRIEAKPQAHFTLPELREHPQSHHICGTRKLFLENLPTLSGLKTVRIQEERCYFKGAHSCSYRIAV